MVAPNKLIVSYVRQEYLQLIDDLENEIARDLAAHLYSAYVFRLADLDPNSSSHNQSKLLPAGFSRWPLFPQDFSTVTDSTPASELAHFDDRLHLCARVPRPNPADVYVNELDCTHDCMPSSDSRKTLEFELNACLQRSVYARIHATAESCAPPVESDQSDTDNSSSSHSDTPGPASSANPSPVSVDLDRTPVLSESSLDRLFSTIHTFLDDIVGRVDAADPLAMYCRNTATTKAWKHATKPRSAFYAIERPFTWTSVASRNALVGNLYVRCQRLFGHESVGRGRWIHPQSTLDDPHELQSHSHSQSQSQSTAVEHADRRLNTLVRRILHNRHNLAQRHSIVSQHQKLRQRMAELDRYPRSYRRPVDMGSAQYDPEYWPRFVTSQENLVQYYGGGTSDARTTQELWSGRVDASLDPQAHVFQDLATLADSRAPIDDSVMDASDLVALHGVGHGHSAPDVVRARAASQRRARRARLYRAMDSSLLECMQRAMEAEPEPSSADQSAGSIAGDSVADDSVAIDS